MEVDVPSPDGSREMESESDRESSSADEAQVERALASLNASSSFDAYQNAISVMRKAGHDILAIRKLRTDFADKFPLPAGMWVEWAEDELMIAASAADRRFVADGVIARGLRDYVSTPLSRKLLDVQIERARAGEVEAFAVVEALGMVEHVGAAAHFKDGMELWGVCFRFMCEKGMTENVRERVERQMKSQVLRKSEGEDEGSPEMQELVAACEVFESKLDDAREESQKEPGIRSEELKSRYVAYASFLAEAHPGSAKSVWERCIEECFLDNALWAQYAAFCRAHRTLGEEREVLERAVRNVPWDLSAWCQRVRNISSRFSAQAVSADAAASELVQVLHSAHAHVFNSTAWDDAMRLSIAALACYGRVRVADARKTAFATVTYSEAGSEQWAHCKFAVAGVCRTEGDADGAVGHIEEVVAQRPTEGMWWQRYAQFLLRARAPDERVRAVFQRGIRAVTGKKDVEMLGSLWTDFEAASPKHFDSAHEETEKRISALRKEAPEKPKSKGPSKAQRRASDKAEKEKETKNGTKDTASKKRKRPDFAKRIRKNAPTSSAQPAAEKEPSAQKSSGAASSEIAGKEKDTSAPGKVEYELNTVFINNLPYKATEEDLREKFEKAGPIKAIRIPKRGDGAAKGIAYIEFADAASMEAALGLHNTPVRGRGVWVRRSKPPRKGVAGKSRGARKTRGASARNRGRLNLNMEIPDVVQGEGVADPKAGDGDAEMVDAGEDLAPDGAVQGATEEFKTQDDFRAMMLGKK